MSPSSTRDPNKLRLGSDVIHLLIPHRRPLLMVDRIESFEAGAEPQLRASRSISANEPVFAGHFEHLALWPGIYTIEGMGQSTYLCMALDLLCNASHERGEEADAPLHALRNLEKGFRLDAAYDREAGARFLATLRAQPPWIGLSTTVDVRFLRPVYAGDRLEYRVRRTHLVDRVARFDVEAFVDGAQVARGRMTGTPLGAALPGL